MAQGDSREVGLDVLLNSGWTIFRAVKSEPWPGEAALYVAQIWAIRGGGDLRGLTSSLEPHSRVTGAPYSLAALQHLAYQGSIPVGDGFVIERAEATRLIEEHPALVDVILPYLMGEDLAAEPLQAPSRSIVNFREMTLEEARSYPAALKIVEERVKASRLANRDRGFREKWWLFGRYRARLYKRIADLDEVLVTPRVSKYSFFVLASVHWTFSDKVIVLATSNRGIAAVLSSSWHDAWVRRWSSTLKFDLNYAPTDCLENFAFPASISGLVEIGTSYQAFRKETMLAEDQGLTKIYNRVHEQPEDCSVRIEELRRLRRELDRAVADAYGWLDLELDHDFRETPLGLRYTISEAVKTEALDRLLELNHARYAEEVAQGLHAKGTRQSKKGGRKRGSAVSESLFDA